ncbi:MAG: hypothetical protein NDF57_07555 [archaeon GBS-70-058]|nr:hypothetical protein [Candidatus Culexarchaeum nevadense]
MVSLLSIFLLTSYYSSILVANYKADVSTTNLKGVASLVASQLLEAVNNAYGLNVGGVVMVKLDIPDDCPLGPYSITISSSSGVTTLTVKPTLQPMVTVNLKLPISPHVFSIVESTVYSGARWNYVRIVRVGFSSFILELVYVGGGV